MPTKNAVPSYMFFFWAPTKLPPNFQWKFSKRPSESRTILTYDIDGRNPANQLICRFSHYLHGFYTSQVVQDFFHQQYPEDGIGSVESLREWDRGSLGMKDLGCQAVPGGGTDRAHKGAQKAVAFSNLAWPQTIVTTISSMEAIPGSPEAKVAGDALLHAYYQ